MLRPDREPRARRGGVGRVILKTQVNLRINADMNISQSFEHVVGDEDDAEEFGRDDCLAFFDYMRGWTSGTAEANAE